MASNTNQNIYFEMDFSPGDEMTDHSEFEVDHRYLSPACEATLAKAPSSRAVSQEYFLFVSGSSVVLLFLNFPCFIRAIS